MKFKDESDGDMSPEALPKEWPFAVILEDLECSDGTMFVVTRETVYRIPTQKFIRWLNMYATKVENDTLNTPSLEKIDEACKALKGAMLAEM